MSEPGEFSGRLKWLRENRGLTKYKLAKTSGIAVAYLSQLEKGDIKNPRQDTLTALARGLNVSLPDLMGQDTRPPSEILNELETYIGPYIPVYATVSAGPGSMPIDYVVCSRLKPYPKSVRGYRIKGFCLDPWIHDSDTIIVDTALSPSNGGFVSESVLFPDVTSGTLSGTQNVVVKANRPAARVRRIMHHKTSQNQPQSF